MSSKNVPGVAKSNYRQIRLFITQETSGVLSYSIAAKPLHADWTEQRVLVRDIVRVEYPVVSYEDVIHALIDTLKEQLLPGIE